MNDAPTRVLVTGAAGRIGRATLELLAEQGVAAHALDQRDPGDLPADLVVEGDACDPRAVREALAGVDAVIHLAAIATPLDDPPETVFSVNTRSTYTVLELAGAAGIRRVSIASSIAMYGISFAAKPVSPAYVPIDEDLPRQAEDPYALSKQVDELTATMMARRYGMGVVALRLPFVGGAAGRLSKYAEEFAREPEQGASSLWAYLETRDAARAFVLGLSVPGPGMRAVLVAAPNTMVPQQTEDLLRRFHPGAEVRRPLPGRAAPVDTSAAARLLGFRPGYLLL
ncbi:NAD(P)-dependent oxidoreductase [Streptosporangiaceae bacterium NEAU-GS5]|nr:NAD(P)-dependent oxidoreductase [Streptosporangiaceae bacterium NEAU-GS5]